MNFVASLDLAVVLACGLGICLLVLGIMCMRCRSARSKPAWVYTRDKHLLPCTIIDTKNKNADRRFIMTEGQAFRYCNKDGGFSLHESFYIRWDYLPQNLLPKSE